MWHNSFVKMPLGTIDCTPFFSIVPVNKINWKLSSLVFYRIVFVVIIESKYFFGLNPVFYHSTMILSLSVNSFAQSIINQLHPSPQDREFLFETQLNWDDFNNNAPWDYPLIWFCNKMYQTAVMYILFAISSNLKIFRSNENRGKGFC